MPRQLPEALPPQWPYEINWSSPQAAGLVAWWPMEPAGGGRCFDRVGRIHGDILPDALWRGGPWLGHSFADTNSGRRVDLGPSNTQAQAINLSRGFSICGWAFWFNGTSGMPLVSTGTSGYEFRLNGQAKMNLVKTGVVELLTAPNQAPQAQWFHMGLTVSADSTATIRFYENGLEVANTTTTQTFDGGSNRAALGGYAGDSAAESWDGGFTDVRVYGRELSAAEMRALVVRRYELYRPTRRRQVWGAFSGGGGGGSAPRLGDFFSSATGF